VSAHHHRTTVSAKEVTLPADHIIHKLPRLGMLAGVVGLGAAAGLSFVSGWKAQFFGVYLSVYFFFLTLALGGLFFVLLQFASRSGWSITVRRMAEFIMGGFVPRLGKVTIPMMAILFIPVLFGLHTLYEWTDPKVMASHAALTSKQAYLNLPFFLVRMVFYFGVWILMARYFLSKSLEQDRTGDHELTKKMQARSYVGIALFALTITFAGFDWIMSIDPHWYSTIFGVYMFAGANVAVYATLALSFLGLQRMNLIPTDVVTKEHLHAIGKMLFGFNVFWTYIAFSQFFLIWYANIPEETKWFAYRLSHKTGWMNFTYILVIGHFIIPFFFMMSRHIKRNNKLFAMSAVWLLLMHLLDMYWLIVPTLYEIYSHHHHLKHHLHFGIADVILLVTIFVGIGGFFLAAVTSWMSNNRLVANQDPRLSEALKMENL
jgi:hypothetical protein